MSVVKDVSESSFKACVIDSEVPVLVDFWAPRCSTCKAMGSGLEALAMDNAGKVDIVKIDVDTNPNLAAQYSIRSIPAVLIFSNGEEVKRVQGLQNRVQLQKLIDSL